MWTAVLAVLALAHAGHGFIMYGFSVPSNPEYGATVYLEANYQLNRGEFIKKMRWLKDGVVFLSYSQRPEEYYDWTDIPGLNIDRSVSTASKITVADVGDSASGQYTLDVQVFGPGGNVANIVNSQSMNVGGLATRFGGGNIGSPGGASFFQSTSSFGNSPTIVGGGGLQTSYVSSGGGVPGSLGTRGSFQGVSNGGVVGSVGATSFQSSSVGPDGVHTAFQSASTGGDALGTRGAFQSSSTGAGVGPGVVHTVVQSGGTAADVYGAQQAVDWALAGAEMRVQAAVNQINRIQQALAGLNGVF